MLTLDFGAENRAPRNSNPRAKEKGRNVPTGKVGPDWKTRQSRRNLGRSQLFKIAKRVSRKDHVWYEGKVSGISKLLQWINF